MTSTDILKPNKLEKPSLYEMAGLGLILGLEGSGLLLLWLLQERGLPLSSWPVDNPHEPSLHALAQAVEKALDYPGLASPLSWLLDQTPRAKPQIDALSALMRDAKTWELECGALAATLSRFELDRLLYSRGWERPQEILSCEREGGEGICYETLLRLARARRPESRAEEERLTFVIKALKKELGDE